MIQLIQVVGNKLPGSDALPFVELSMDKRIKSRQRVVLDNGSNAALFLVRGTLLRDGDIVESREGERVRIVAAREKVSTARCSEPLLLARAAYHLGNRHVPLEITPDYVRYQHDHVLDEMLMQMGIEVATEMAPFEPEAGAYLQQGGHGHHHHH